MEEHRLKEMGSYDLALFKRLYKQLTPLKRKLASNIQYDKLGLDYEDVMAELDIKFLFVFQKYHKEMPENLLQAHLIRALQFYRNRILKEIYKDKNSSPRVELNDITEHEYGLIEDSLEESKACKLQIAVDWVSERLSFEASLVFRVELNPPSYIINKLQEQGRKQINHIPALLVCEYLGWPTTQTQINRISEYRREIRGTVEQARRSFLAGKINIEVS